MDTKYADDILEMMGSLGGKFNVITGINGSGKTNLLKSISNNYPKNILISGVKNFIFDLNTFNNINNKDINIINNNCNTVKFNFLLNRADKINLTETKTLRDLMDKIIDIIAPYDNGTIEIDRQTGISYGMSTDHCDENCDKKRESVVREMMVWRKHHDKYGDDLSYFLLYNKPPNIPNSYGNYELIDFILEQLQTDKEWKYVYNWTNVRYMAYRFSIIEAILKIVRVDDVSHFFWSGLVGLSKKLIEERLNIYDKFNLVKSHNNFVELKLECERVKGNISYIDTMFSGNTINTVMNGIRHVSAGEKQALDLIFLSHFIENGEYKFLSNDGNLIDKPDIILLDEPDCFLNPQLAKTMLEVIKKEFVEKDIKVIMTTHNPSTVAYCQEDEIFWMENGEVLQDEKRKTKQEILSNLLPGILTNIGGTKQDPYLYFVGDATKEWYIFVEGATDIEHFKNACKSLGYNNILENCNFLQFFGTKNTDCYNMMKNFTNKEIGRKAIAIFDYDKSGMEEFNKFGCQKEKNLQSNQHKQSSNNLHAIRLIPANNNEFILPAKYGYIPIELLYKKKLVEEFFNYQDKTRKQFTQDEINSNLPDEYYITSWQAGDGLDVYDDVWKLINKEEDDLFIKDKFAKHITENISNIDFSDFKKTLDAINSIINK